ncbi:MAG TPA: HIT family protein [Ramlibacter sp.]|uniref:HIT family protein n=1 Tax=Ramlibacter sp. TaxID=1917967 RepID=UPI002C8C03BE|nr:HIT family protein [Ramlibacter sp.]HVZ42431.1 HIT family protein [Ramlibacter sp.]
MREEGCALCEGAGGALVAQSARWRIVRADEPGFPAFYRVIWNDHVREFSDLTSAQRAECMDAVVQVETLIREHLQPAKVNLASLGNAVAHLHWHVIARFEWDSHFPGAVWAEARREPDAGRLARVEALRGILERDLGKLAFPA